MGLFSRKVYVLHYREEGTYSYILGVFSSLKKAVQALDIFTYKKRWHLDDRYNVYEGKRNQIEWDGLHMDNTIISQTATERLYICEKIKQRCQRYSRPRRLTTVDF